MTAPTPGFHPPISDNGIGAQQPLDLQWLSKPMVAVGVVDAGTPFVTGPLPRGAYTIWVSDPAYVNAGTDGAAGLDHTVTSANAQTPEALARAPKVHEGGQWPVPVNEGDMIALKAISGSVAFRIWEAL
ncbi:MULTISPECIES: hypothetical protein [Methylobacterium]|uniref:hypothetical protein n=1 Tax=Methylobacterium TaxID=407 RepID=UPI00272E8BFA|nr:hypothetical protein [Methylobacterium sp.]